MKINVLLKGTPCTDRGRVLRPKRDFKDLAGLRSPRRKRREGARIGVFWGSVGAVCGGSVGATRRWQNVRRPSFSKGKP